MPLQHYSQLFGEIKKSRFLKVQSITLFLVTYIDWTLIPFITKLEGTYLPVFMISFFMLIGALDGFLQPVFKNIKIYNIYLFAIFLDIFQIFCYFIYDYSILYFTYVILTIFTIQGITFEISRIHTTDFMQDESIELKDYMILRSLMISSAIVAGSFSSMIFDYLELDFYYLLIYLSVIGFIGIYLQIILYIKFKKRVYAQVEVQSDKKELYEKFRV